MLLPRSTTVTVELEPKYRASRLPQLSRQESQAGSATMPAKRLGLRRGEPCHDLAVVVDCLRAELGQDVGRQRVGLCSGLLARREAKFL